MAGKLPSARGIPGSCSRPAKTSMVPRQHRSRQSRGTVTRRGRRILRTSDVDFPGRARRRHTATAPEAVMCGAARTRVPSKRPNVRVPIGERRRGYSGSTTHPSTEEGSDLLRSPAGPAQKARNLAQQESGFTSEGSPPPGNVARAAPVTADNATTAASRASTPIPAAHRRTRSDSGHLSGKTTSPHRNSTPETAVRRLARSSAFLLMFATEHTASARA